MCTCVSLLVLGAVAIALATPLPQREERSPSLGLLEGLNVAQRKGKNQRYGGGYGGYEKYRPNRVGSGAGSSASASSSANADSHGDGHGDGHGGGALSSSQAQSQSQSHSASLGLGPFSGSISNSQSQAQSNSGAFGGRPGVGGFYDY